MSVLFGDQTMLRHGLSSVYVAPNETAYHLQKAFTITTENGTLWAIAFSARAGRYLNTSLTVIFTLMFTWLWGLIAAATIYFVPHQFSRRRLVALVALRNSQDPWSAFMAFANFTTESMGLFRRRNAPSHGPTRLQRREAQTASTWQDTMFGLLLVLLALIVILTRVIMSIILPPSLQIGNVAPVNESVTFYPRATWLDSDSTVYRAFRAGPSLRALSSAQVYGDAIRGRVKVQRDLSVTTQNRSQPMYGLTYSYHISGVELGLKTAGDLVLSVNGSCRTEYGWFNAGASNDTTEVIDIFGDPANNFTAHTEDRFLGIVPTVAFTLANNVTYKKQLKEGNVSYAVIATLSGHLSNTENNNDPWYLTGGAGSGSGPDLPYRIQPRRPALSCWHHDRWSAGDGFVDGGSKLDDLSALGVPQVLKDVLATALLQPPPYTIGTDTGSSALISVLSSRNSQKGTIDAGAGSIHQDMERLVIGGFILTLNRLSDMVMYTPGAVEMEQSNLFHSKKNATNDPLPFDGRGEFLVSSPNIATFNLAGLIATGAVVLFLLVGQLVLTAKLNFHTTSKVLADSRARGPHDMDPHQEADRFNDDRWARFRAFSAIHLLRNTYEDGTGKPEDDWRCSENLPTPTDQKMLRLVRCHHGDEDCAGHIATDPELLLGIRAASRASIGAGPGKRVRTSITSLPENASFRAYDPATGRTQTLSHTGSLPGYTPVGQFEMRPLDEVNNPRASITSSNAGKTVSETSYTSPSIYGNMAPAGGATPYSITTTPPTSYFSPVPSAGFGQGPYFSAAASPPAHGGGQYVGNSAVVAPYHDEDDIAISASASALRNANSAPLLATTGQSGGTPTPPQSSQQRSYFNARMN